MQANQWGELSKRSGRWQTRAFTMVELLLVLVILAVLAAIVVPRLVGRGEDAKIQAAQTQISNFQTALDLFEVDMGYYPEGANAMYDLIEPPPDDYDWKGPYLSNVMDIPPDPWRNPYIYEYPGRFNIYGYDLFSMGPDMEEGTEDDITNWDMGVGR